MIEIRLARTSVFTRWPCTICGGHTEKVEVLAEGVDEFGHLVRVCESCLEAGDIDRRIDEHIAAAGWDADYLAALKGRLNVPTFREWEEAMLDAIVYWIEYEINESPQWYEDLLRECVRPLPPREAP